MTTEQEAERLRRRMATLRRRLDDDVSQVTTNASRLLEWRHYVSQYPWVTLGAVALAAYWVIPGRRTPQKVVLDRTSIDELIKRGGVQFETPQKTKEKAGWISAGVSLLATLALRGATAYLTQHFQQAGMRAFQRSSSQHPQEVEF